MLKAKGQAWTAEEEQAYKAPIEAKYEREGHPYYASARIWDDGIVVPADTRQILGLSLFASRHAPQNKTDFGIFRM